MNFGVYGGYEMPRINGLVTKASDRLRDFWDEVDEDLEGLSGACGCYVFAAQNRPWYVGKAEKQSFRRECFGHHKITRYNEVLARYQRAAPHLYLFPRLTSKGNLSLPSKKPVGDVAALETFLIGLAISRNEDVVNVSGTRFLRRMNVPGIINTQRGQGRAYAAQEIRSLFGLK